MTEMLLFKGQRSFKHAGDQNKIDFLVCSSHRSMEYLKNNLENSSKSIDTVYDCDCSEVTQMD